MDDENKSEFSKRVRNYADLLDPIFDATFFSNQTELFELICTLVRCSGIHDANWDAFHESEAILDDLRNLASLDLPADSFPNAQRTKMRLALLSYCHLIEMDLPYVLLANLLRLRTGLKYHVDPFGDLAKPIRKKKSGLVLKSRAPSPSQKIERIKELAQKAKVAGIDSIFDSIYDSDIRNAVYHSDYTLTNDEFRMLAGRRFSRKRKYISQIVDWDELNELFTGCFAFYSAILGLYVRCRKAFGDFEGAIIPYDLHYKGLLQIEFEEGSVTGFRVYWPNGTTGYYSRTARGSAAVNLRFDPDGSVNFMVGLYASHPASFSPLVESHRDPQYAEIPGTQIRPHWPTEIGIYKADLTPKSIQS